MGKISCSVCHLRSTCTLLQQSSTLCSSCVDFFCTFIVVILRLTLQLCSPFRATQAEQSSCCHGWLCKFRCNLWNTWCSLLSKARMCVGNPYNISVWEQRNCTKTYQKPFHQVIMCQNLDAIPVWRICATRSTMDTVINVLFLKLPPVWKLQERKLTITVGQYISITKLSSYLPERKPIIYLTEGNRESKYSKTIMPHTDTFIIKANLQCSQGPLNCIQKAANAYNNLYLSLSLSLFGSLSSVLVLTKIRRNVRVTALWLPCCQWFSGSVTNLITSPKQ